MKLILAPSLLLMVLHCDPAVAFAPPSHATKSTQTSVFNYNDDYQNDNYHPIQNEPNVDLARRESTGAFFRGLTAAGAIGAAGAAMRPQNAWASETPVKPVRSAKKASFDQIKLVHKLRSNPGVNSSVQYRNSLAEMEPAVIGAGAAATVGFFAMAGEMSQTNINTESSMPAAPKIDANSERLASIENRVDSLEQRIEQLPDQIYDRMESWRVQQENRWGVESSSAATITDNIDATPAPPSTPTPQVVVASTPTTSGRGMGGYLDSLTASSPPTPPRRKAWVTSTPKSSGKGMGGYLDGLAA
jgi:hypothetical protein